MLETLDDGFVDSTRVRGEIIQTDCKRRITPVTLALWQIWLN